MRKNMMRTFVMILVLAVSIGMTGCGQGGTEAGSPISEGGLLTLKVNPEIDIRYDADGKVTAVDGMNDDGKGIVADYSNFLGKECKDVVRELVTLIGDAGYFVEEVEGEGRQITIEIESGSVQPSDDFLNGIVGEIKGYVKEQEVQKTDVKVNKTAPIVFEGESNYGMTDYSASDYDDAVTNYDDAASNYDDAVSNYNDAVSNYNDSAYGTTVTVPVTGGDSNYDDAASNYDDAVSNYDDAASNYGNSSNYNASSYDSGSNYGDSGYGGSSYGGSSYGDSGYDD